MATVCFLPDKADHTNVLDYDREAARYDAACSMRVQAPATSPGQAEDFDRPLPHLNLPDLAGHRHRELIDDVHVPGDLVMRKLPGTE
jgi:hypothetical protein